MAKPADRAPKPPTPKAAAPKAAAPKAAAPKAAASKPRGGSAPPKARPVSAAVPVTRPVRVPEQPPRTVAIAVKLMYAGAILSAIDLIITLATAGQLRGLLHTAHPNWSDSRVTTYVHAQVTSSVFIWVVTIALWVVMARTNQAGRNWARVVATVLCAFSTLSFAEAILQPASLVSKLVYAPLWLVGVGAIVLLWRSETTAYIRAGQES
jgi:hypothetical protein